MSDTSRWSEFVDLLAAVHGRYSLQRELGRGGMGIVYLAHDIALDRPVAIKLLFPYLATRVAFREQFLAEARIAAKLSHPNIVTVHAVEDHDGLVFFIMAFVNGETLGHRIDRAGPLRPSEAVRLMREVAWALGYAHGNGIIHRDVKPDNILIEQCLAKRPVHRPKSGEEIAETLGASSAVLPEASPEIRLFLRRTGLLADRAAGMATIVLLSGDAYLRVHGAHLSPTAITQLVVFVATFSAAAIGWFILKPALKIRRAGFDWKDVHAAIRDEERRSSEEAALMVSRFTERSDELDRDQLRSLSRHTTAARGKPQEQGRYSAVAIGIGFLVVSGALALLYFGAMRMFDVRSLVVTLILTSVATLAVVLPLFVGLSASGAAFRDPSIRVNPGDVIDMALKNSWWGRLFSTFRAGAEDVVTPIREQLIRLAGLGMPAAQRRAVAAVPQSTEFMLGIAVEAEFHQLPEPDRIYFADVPNVVQRLRETGVRIRKNVQRDAGNAIRLATVTAALDDLRLTLVKLRAGSISEGDLTASIKEIEAIGRRVDAELEARAEVAAMLRAEKSK